MHIHCAAPLDAAYTHTQTQKHILKNCEEHQSLFTYVSARPYESCKIFKGRPCQNAFSNLVHRQYKSFPPDKFLSDGNQEHNWVEY